MIIEFIDIRTTEYIFSVQTIGYIVDGFIVCRQNGHVFLPHTLVHFLHAILVPLQHRSVLPMVSMQILHVAGFII